MRETRHELRCHCSRRVLLAVYGRTAKGKSYVHQKVHKQGKVYGESVVESGTVAIRCRECLRWTRVRIRSGEQKVIAPSDRAPEMATEVEQANACRPFPQESRL